MDTVVICSPPGFFSPFLPVLGFLVQAYFLVTVLLRPASSAKLIGDWKKKKKKKSQSGKRDNYCTINIGDCARHDV